MRQTPRSSTRTGASALVVAGILTVTAGCGGGDDAPDAAPAADAATDDAATDDATGPAAIDYGLVTVAEAVELAALDGVTVVDVRTPAEFAEGHLEGARLIDFNDASFADQVALLDPDGRYLVYCRSGNRSAQAVAVMQQLGIDRIWDMEGGVIAYAQEGYPLVR